MLYRLLADVVMLAHFGFLVFLVLGGFLAWRHRGCSSRTSPPSAGRRSASRGMGCPLTAWEDGLRRLAGEHGLPRGFVDTYLTGVVYPEAYLRPAQFLVAALIATSWAGLAVRARHAQVRR